MIMKIMRRPLFSITLMLALAAAAGPAATLTAQDASAALPPVGARIRVWTPNTMPLRTDTIARSGRFHDVDAGDILLRRFGTVAPLRIPASQIVRVERYVSGTTRGQSAFTGALLGSALPLMLGRLTARGDSDGAALTGAAIIVYGTPAGAVVGGVIGYALARGERWAPVPWPPSGTR